MGESWIETQNKTRFLNCAMEAPRVQQAPHGLPTCIGNLDENEIRDRCTYCIPAFLAHHCNHVVRRTPV